MPGTYPGYKWTTKPPRGNAVDLAHPLSRGLVDFHVLNEGSGTTAFDIGRYGRNATVNGAGTAWAASAFGPALRGGGSAHIAAAAGHILFAFTHEAVFVPATATGQPISAISVGPTSGTTDRGLCIDGTGKFAFSIFDGATKVVTGTTVVVSGRPYHVVATADRTNIRIYVNGALEGTTAATDAYTGYGGAPVLLLGQDMGGGQSLQGTDGYIVHHRVWDRPLSPGEVRGLAAVPYGMMLAPAARRFFAPAAGSGPVSPVTLFMDHSLAGGLQTLGF